MKHTLLSFAALALPFVAHAQAYTFEQTTTPYLPLADVTICVFDGNGFDDLTELDGQVFHFFGQSYTAGTPYSMTIGSGGFVRVDGTTTAIIIDGLFTDLTPVDATSSVDYLISGGPGEHTLTAQWTNWHLNLGPDGNYASFQITVEQATGVVSVHIGPNSGGGLVFNDLTGPNCGIFQADNAFTHCIAKLWVEVDPVEPDLDVQPNFDFDALHGLPPEGTMYRFIPLTAGIASVAGASFNAYASQDGVHVQFSDAAPRTLQLLDASGREVRRARTSGTTIVIPTADLTPGIYVMRPIDGRLAPMRLWIP